MEANPLKLVVVGNAEPREDQSEFIDHCDTVIRFNFTPFFDTRRTGSKTTNLCLLGVPYPNLGEIPQLNHDIVDNILDSAFGIIWVESPLFFEPLARGYRIWRNRITPINLHNIQDRYAIERIQRPSSGFQVLRYVVNAPAFVGIQKFICGFEFRGGPLHPWEQEKRQVEHYIELGLLNRDIR